VGGHTDQAHRLAVEQQGQQENGERQGSGPTTGARSKFLSGRIPAREPECVQ
jgi:hypothetical protein